jgi:hypothetical protein
MQFSLLYRYDPAGPGPVESDIDAWIALSEDLQREGKLLHESGFFPASDAIVVTAAIGSLTKSPAADGESIVAASVATVGDANHARLARDSAPAGETRR